MGLPAKRRTRTSKRERASHFALHPTSVTLCGHCRKTIVPHRVCPFCGWYRGREVIHLTTALDRRAKKKAERLGQRQPAPEEKEDKSGKKDKKDT